MVLEGSSQLIEEYFATFPEEKANGNSWGPEDWCRLLKLFPFARPALTLPCALGQTASPTSSKSGSTPEVASGSRCALIPEILFFGTRGECTTTAVLQVTEVSC